MIVFGGSDEQTDFDDTWAYEPAPKTWTELSTDGVRPSARTGHSMAYDPASATVTLYGGWTGYQDVDETWEYDPSANTWTNLHPAGEVPSARDSHCAAYDPQTGKMILFGGWDGYVYLDDTWAYDPVANSWTELQPAGGGPSKRIYSAMTYDPGTGRMILFGGSDENADLADTWAYDPSANAWSRLRPAGDTPGARNGHAMVCDPQSGKVILFGGWKGVDDLDDTWAYDAASNTWADIVPAGGAPSPRWGHSIAYDPQSGKIILFGGISAGTLLNDIWAFEPGAGTWTTLDPGSALPRARGGHALVYCPDSEKTLLFGGWDNDGLELGDTWLLDPVASEWAELSPAGSLPAPRDSHAMVYDPASGKVILFGGYNGRFDLNDTWAYDPGADSWTDLNPAGALPPPRDGHSMVYDPVSRRMIVFGGWDDYNYPLSDTWAYDPAANMWTELRPAGAVPEARTYHSMVHDPHSGKIVLFGGATGDPGSARDVRATVPHHETASDHLLRVAASGEGDGATIFGDTWTYDPATNTWTKLSFAGAEPSARDSHTMVYDAGAGLMILYGGWGDDEALDEIWSFDPAANVWTYRSPASFRPFPRNSQAMAYDAGSDTVIMFGGWDGYTTLGDTWVLEK